MFFPWRRRRPFTSVGALEGQGSFRLLRPKKDNRNFNRKVFPKKVNKNFHRSSKKRSTKIALGTRISPEKQNFHLELDQKKVCPPNLKVLATPMAGGHGKRSTDSS